MMSKAAIFIIKTTEKNIIVINNVVAKSDSPSCLSFKFFDNNM